MACKVVGLAPFIDWFMDLDRGDSQRATAAIEYLEQEGHNARRPVVGAIKNSRYPNMKELRAGSLRILFCFDPDQQAILLLGADKAQEGWKGWYAAAIRRADDLMDAWLANPTTDD